MPAPERGPRPRPSADADALDGVLARAVAERASGPLLARYLVPPDDYDVQSGASPGEDWTEANGPPLGVAFVNRGSRKKKDWYMWNPVAKQWERSLSPAQVAGEVRQGRLTLPTPVVGTPRAEPPVDQPVSEDVEDVVEDKPPPTPFPIMNLPLSVLANVIDMLPTEDIPDLRLVNNRFEAAASAVLRNRMQARIRKKAISSIDGKLFETLAAELANLNARELFVLSDQVSEETIENLTGNIAITARDRRKRRNVITGYQGGTSTDVYSGEHTKPHSTAPQIPVGERHGNLDYVEQLHGPMTDSSSKMHVKSIIGSDEHGPLFLETGSANFTWSADTRNTEAIVVLMAAGIAKMFKEYADLVVQGLGTGDARQFEDTLADFNRRNPIGIRAALAPFVNVGEQLTTELRGADWVVVRMFLVSKAAKGPSNQPLETLRKLGKQATVVVDEEQSKLRYVYEALDELKWAGAHVYTETGRGGGIMHDKLIFAHYPAKPETAHELPTPERWTVMIGSSGLTRNVIANENYENLLVIDDKALFHELFDKHHCKAQPYRKPYRTNRAPPRRTKVH